jgi:hypothetical protein
MRFADTWWSDEKNVGGGLQVAAGAQFGDEFAVQDRGQRFGGVVQLEHRQMPA